MAPKVDKAERKAAARARRAQSRQRRAQIIEAFKIQRREDKWLIPWLLLAFLGSIGVAFGIAVLLGVPWFIMVPLGVLVGVLLAVIVFGRRVQRSVYAKADGQPGAAGWALDNLRGRWRVKTAVAGTTQLDVVHRVIGRPGVILVAEGAPHRVKALLAQEKKRVARVVGDTPIYDVIVGNEDGQVRLSRLHRHLTKLPRNISVSHMDTLETRLAALASRGGVGPAMPKGPMPQGAKMRNLQRTVRRR